MTSPSILNPLAAGAGSLLGSLTSSKPRANDAPSTGSTTSASSSASGTASGASSQTSLTSLGSTFLTLLTQELQNQDPTAPMDSTQMVGQMISLNQLDQLISINQTLTPTTTATTPAGGTTAHLAGAKAASQGGSDPLSALDPSSALGGNQSALAALAAQNSSSTAPATNAAPLNLGTLTNLIGGK